MIDIQEKIQDLERSHKSQFRYLIIGIILLILILIFIHFYGPGSKVIFTDDKGYKASVDSMRIHDKQRSAEILQLQQIHAQDSILISDIQDQLDNTQTMIDNINRKYAKERNNLDNSSANIRLQFLSNHLPKTSH